MLRTPVNHIEVPQLDGQKKNMHRLGKNLKPEPIVSPKYFNLIVDGGDRSEVATALGHLPSGGLGAIAAGAKF